MKTKKIILALIFMSLFVGCFWIASKPTWAAQGKIAVTPAHWDDIGEVLSSLGFDYDEIEVADLTKLETLKQYSTVYINCSYDLDQWAEQAGPVLKQYVQEGGVIYASDYANSIMQESFPGKINFYNPYGDPELLYSAARSGESGVFRTGTRVHMTGPSSVPELTGNIPYVLTFTEGDGEVLYTSFHNEAQTTAQVQKVLEWFAVRTHGGGLAKETRDLALQSEEAILQEVVDSISQGETQEYLFNASGEADFAVFLNFGGSALNLTLLDPSGKEIFSKEVSAPPFSQAVTATAGLYKLKVEGVDVPTKNMPFVLTLAGPEKAAAEPIVTDQDETKPGLGKIVGIVIVVLALGFLVFVGIIILVIVLIVRRKK